MKNFVSRKSAIICGTSILILSAGGYFMKINRQPGKVPTLNVDVKPRKAIVRGTSYKAVQNEMKSCYESMLVRNPELSNGDVLFHFTFNKSGSVHALELVHSDFPEEQFQNCVTQKVKEMQTDVAPERIGILIAHRFKFHRKDETNIQFE